MLTLVIIFQSLVAGTVLKSIQDNDIFADNATDTADRSVNITYGKEVELNSTKNEKQENVPPSEIVYKELEMEEQEETHPSLPTTIAYENLGENETEDENTMTPTISYTYTDTNGKSFKVTYIFEKGGFRLTSKEPVKESSAVGCYTIIDSLGTINSIRYIYDQEGFKILSRKVVQTAEEDCTKVGFSNRIGTDVLNSLIGGGLG